jgi:hypothetical protein
VRARRHAASFTADMERFSSLGGYRARMQQGIERARCNVDSRLADIRTAQMLFPERAEEFEELRPVVLDTRALAELSGQLLSPSCATRLSAFARLIRAGAYREHVLQHAALVLAPKLYLRYKRRRFALTETVHATAP